MDRQLPAHAQNISFQSALGGAIVPARRRRKTRIIGILVTRCCESRGCEAVLPWLNELAVYIRAMARKAACRAASIATKAGPAHDWEPGSP